MKNTIITLLGILLLSQYGWADIDVTSLYLQNAGFDDEKHFDYTTADNGNVSQEILDVYGWSKDISVDYTITGVYQIGTAKTFNTYGVIPSRNYDGNVQGGCLALSTGWDQSLKFYQTITLPAGSYKLQAAFYNGSNTSNGGSLLGWFSSHGESLSTLASFPTNEWTLDEVAFSLSEESTGRVQIGFQGAANGSANSAKVAVDFVKIMLIGDDNTLVAQMREQLNQTLSLAQKCYGEGTGNEAEQLKAKMDKAQSSLDNNGSYLLLYQQNQELQKQLTAYEWANATIEQPSDMTSMIVNNSFEEGFEGWAQSGMQTQSNSDFTRKEGKLYAEKWVSNGTFVGNAYVTQTIKDPLPKGIYILKANAHNTQGGVSNQQGAFLVSNNDSVEVSESKEYALQFTLLEEQLMIGYRMTQATGNWVAVDNFRLYYAAATMSDYKKEMQKRMDYGYELTNGNIGTECQSQLSDVLQKAEQWLKQPDLSTLSSLAQQLRTATEKAQNSLAKADFREKIENATGPKPVVTTDPRSARGATMAFGRATFEGSNIMEKGFCWSTEKNPTVLDNRSSLSYSNNGEIFVMDNLQPATLYYIRPYAITYDYAVGYGDAIRICTLPMGGVTWSYNNGGSAEENERINNAVGDAVTIWNHLTSIQGLHLTVNYGASTPTADCSYGGWMRVGPNASYQRTGTIQHEMCHAAGVGTTERWYNSAIYRQETTKGYWLGERTDQVVRFLENDDVSQLRGDNTHFWPYGINGAHEDNGTRMLYYANALIIQALGEDYLPPINGAFATPAYTFAQEEEESYYLLSAEANQPTLLQMTADGKIGLQTTDWRNALKDPAYAWNVRFDPSTQMYELRNVGRQSAISHYNTQVQSEAKSSYQLQMLGSRDKVTTNDLNLKSYWIIFADGSNHPLTLTASGNTVTAATFDHQNSATAQRWVLLSQKELRILAGEPTEKKEQTAPRHWMVYGGKGTLSFQTTDQGAWMEIYTLSGERVDRFYMQAGMYITRSYVPGIYIVNGKKQIVQ